jgi:alkanesulfonate monooxygenase SsuD/methylene tetrahydromethanopterin reductase-like flavin-dependent oxidoreductase (luciferase family)
MVHLLPFYHPIRLLEEIAMLDHLSGGRLELGVGRGISPPEHEMWGLDPVLARQRSEETLEIILAGMTSNTLNYEGRFWRFEGVPLEVCPFQKPHPPVVSG